MSDKPREFWLDLDGAWYGFDEKIPDAIHVIEKSAYDELQAKADKLAEAMSKSLGELSSITPCKYARDRAIVLLDKALAEYRGEK